MKKISLFIIICLLSLTCLQAQIWEGSYQIRSQEDVDNFSTNCTCTEITGFLIINSSSVNNLNGLSDLREIGGDLSLYNSSNLNNLAGLSNLRSIGGSLVISRNSQLKHVNSLSKLKHIGGGITIERNPRLVHLRGLENIETTSLSHINIYDNDQLNDIDVFDQLKSLSSFFSISTNSKLKNINTFTNLSVVNSRFTFTRNQVEDLNAFQNLKTVTGTFQISDNPLLKTLNLPNLNNVRLLTISGNSRLTEINLPKVTEINGNLSISGNSQLTNLDGFNSLQSVNQSLWISENHALTNIAGLQNVLHIGINLTLSENTALTECCMLSCKIRDRFIGGSIMIENNGNGCGSATELYLGCDEFCLLSSIDDHNEYSISVYPLPAVDHLHINILKNKLNFTYTIYDMNGKIKLNGKLRDSKIEVSNLPKGLYVLNLSNNTTDYILKFMK